MDSKELGFSEDHDEFFVDYHTIFSQSVLQNTSLVVSG